MHKGFILSFLMIFSVSLAQAQVSQESIKELTHQARQGDAKAQYRLGFVYMLGDGVEQSNEQGIRWLKQAGEQDYIPALMQLGWIYETGVIENSQDFVKAVDWYEKAALLGYDIARDTLVMFYEGEGRGEGQFQFDLVKAYAWLSLGNLATDGERKKSQELAQKMTSDQIEEAEKLVQEFKQKIEQNKKRISESKDGCPNAFGTT